MKKECGFGMCGLACCLCSENAHCAGCEAQDCPGAQWCANRKCAIEKGVAGCYACAQDCDKGMLGKVKPRAFTLFIRQYGKDKLLKVLEENEKKGVVYHREGITGDYDDFADAQALLDYLKTGAR